MSKANGTPLPQVSATLIQIVNNQLAANDPPETKQTLERLMAEGYREEDAKVLIAGVIRVEMLHVLKESKPFNAERFIAGLHNLPVLPEEPEV